MPLSRRTLLALACALVVPGPAGAHVVHDLYRGRTIVSGRRDETRIPGMVRSLAQVLVRVSGDPRLAEHPGLAEISRQPEAAATDYTYRDLCAFRPIKDKQGTRDRPHEMTVRYDPVKVDALLARLGSRPWLAARPPLVMVLAVHHIGSTFMLDAAGETGELMRQSFQDAAWSAAMEVVIPARRTIAAASLTVDTMPATPLSTLQTLVDVKRGQVPLAGALNWSRQLLSWTVQWRLVVDGREHDWGIAGVSFDAAFRNGVWGAAQLLSGNGEPG